MTFDQALNIILKQRGHGNKKNNLAEVKKTAAALCLNKLPFKTVLITGTNGKGTTASLLALTLAKAGFKTGLFTSPHIYDVTERIQINGANISKRNFAAAVSRVLEKETIPLKFFEILTLAAMLYFKNSGADYVVLECGIGGRYDCTNIFPRDLSIITSVDIDHAAILGGTIKKIAWQKGGIIKKEIPCVTGRLHKDAKQIIAKEASLKKAKIISAGTKFKLIKQDYKNRKTVFAFEGEEFKLNLLGQAQAQNAAITLLAARQLGIADKFAKQAFADITIPCRFQIIPFNGHFIIKDGAHNPAAIKEFLKTYLASSYNKAQNTLVYAAMADKDYKTAVKYLAPHFKNIVLTCADVKKGVAPQELKPLFSAKSDIKITQNPASINLKELSGNIIITGSFYLCAKII